MMKPRFRVYGNAENDWLCFVALNQEAKDIISGKRLALRPWNTHSPITKEQRDREIAEILRATDGYTKPLEEYYPYKR